jgi:diguanylate cyclase (GGDEF)-like protein
VLPATTRAAAMEFCEMLRGAVESHDWSAVQDELGVTLSIGLSQWDGSADVAELLRSADQQLYRAKRAGRNQVAA